jgi:hypothetical protein
MMFSVIVGYGQNGIDEWMLPYFGDSAYRDPQV